MAATAEGAVPRGEPGSTGRRRGYGRFLGYAVLGSLVPGIGLIAAGRRALGWTILWLWIAVVVGVLIAIVWLGLPGLLALGTDPGTLAFVSVALLLFATLWLVVAVVSLSLLQPGGLSGLQRLSGALAAMVAAMLVVAPLVIASRYTATQSDLLNRIFTPDDKRPGSTGTNEANPWNGQSRVNVLLLGSDAGTGRTGARPDTLIVASIHVENGRTVLLSLPRDLQRVPFPADSPLHWRYPSGFTGPGDPNEWLLNAVYQKVPAKHPKVFEESAHPGADATKWAVEGALGIGIDYFVMVNLEGFQRLVDALGGITVDVHYRIPIETKVDERTGQCTPATGWIKPGLNQRLNGKQALWFARARCGPYPVTDDFNRMERQRCVIGAIVDAAPAMTLLTRYEQIAEAIEDIVVTDIPQRALPAFVDLVRRMRDASVTSLAFTDKVIASRSNPDYQRIRALAAKALEPSPATRPQPEAKPPAATPGPKGPLSRAVDPAAARPLDVLC